MAEATGDQLKTGFEESHTLAHVHFEGSDEHHLMKNAIFWDIETHLYLTENTLCLRYRTQPVNAM
jgi:hypothetical protein